MISEKDKTKKYTAIAIAVTAVVIILLCVFVGIPIIKTAKNPEDFRTWIQAKGVWGPMIYVLVVILQILVAFIPGEPLELAAGYAFGTVQGTLLCLLAETLGTVLVLILVRKLGIKVLNIFFSKEDIEKLSFLKSSNRKIVILLLLFLLPGTPKDLLCFYAGLTDIPMPVLLIICTLCRIPSIITSTLSGSAFMEGNYTFAVIIFLSTLLVSGIGVLIYKKACRS